MASVNFVISSTFLSDPYSEIYVASSDGVVAKASKIEGMSTDEAKKVMADIARKKGASQVTWTDKNKVIQEFTINGEMGWSKVAVAEKKATGQRYLRLRRFKQAFSINTPEDLAALMQTLQDGANSLGWRRGNESQHRKFMDTISQLNSLRKKDLSRIQEMSRQLAELREKHLKLQLPEYKQDLKDFETLLDTAGLEQELQDFLARHTWLLGFEYLDEQPIDFAQFRLSDSRFDFLLRRYDTFFDIIELKMPTVFLFNTKVVGDADLRSPTRDSPLSTDLNNALSQMIGYLELTSLSENNILREKGLLLHKPKGIIVIGRTKKKEQQALTTLKYYFNHIDILTYDDLLTRGKNLVKMLEKRRTPLTTG